MRQRENDNNEKPDIRRDEWQWVPGAEAMAASGQRGGVMILFSASALEISLRRLAKRFLPAASPGSIFVAEGLPGGCIAPPG